MIQKLNQAATWVMTRFVIHPDAVIGAMLVVFLFWLADQPYKGT